MRLPSGKTSPEAIYSSLLTPSEVGGDHYQVFVPFRSKVPSLGPVTLFVHILLRYYYQPFHFDYHAKTMGSPGKNLKGIPDKLLVTNSMLVAKPMPLKFSTGACAHLKWPRKKIPDIS